MKLISVCQKLIVIFFIYSPLVLGADAVVAPPPPAAGSIGLVIWTKGDVTAAQPGGVPRVLTRRSALMEHDTLTTSKDGSVEFTLVDGCVISLDPDSIFKITECSYKEGAGSANKVIMNLVKGGFRTITGAIPKENREGYKINTLVATIGVRGTQYMAALSPTNQLALGIEKGQIEVTNKAGKMELIACASGQSCSTRYGIVKSFDVMPARVAYAPPELNKMVPIIPVPADFLRNISPHAVPPTKTVSGFCIGLLKGLYERIEKFFS